MSFFRAILILLAWLGVFLFVSNSVRAQPHDAQVPQTEGEIRIEVDQFGLGGAVRPGSFAGIRLAVIDLGPRVRQVLLRIHTTDPDGDTVFNERAVTLNPGARQGVWFYPFLPFSFSGNTILTVTAHEVQSDNSPGQLPNPGRQIGIARISPQTFFDSQDALIGVVGRSTLGLEQYRSQYQNQAQPPTSMEWQRVVRLDRGQLALDMPDSALGFDAFDVIVWGEGEPSSLRLETSEAIREWVYTGGHLVVVLPSVGGTWLNASNNPLFDLLPVVTVTRHERVDLNKYHELLTSSKRTQLPTQSVVYAFSQQRDTTGNAFDDTSIILEGPDALGLVARRVLGAGAVTLIGLDLRDRNLNLRIDAQRFWHRVLGFRFDVYSPTVLTEMANRQENRADFAFGLPKSLDADFSKVVDRTGRSGLGVMLGLVLCTVYLLVAGPLGYGMLKKKGLQRYSWSAFLATAIVFTLVAWVSTTSIRPRTVSVQSIAIVDAVYGQQVKRARSWINILLPTYGTQLISIQDSTETDTLSAALTSWDAKSSSGLRIQNRFPDARGYRVDTRHQRAMSVPTRSTVKMFQVDWAGAMSWEFPTPGQGTITVDGSRLSGLLTHQLPAALEHVTVAHVVGQVPIGLPLKGGRLPAIVKFWSLAEPWEPGEPLDLAAVTASEATQRRDSYLDRLTTTPAYYGAPLNPAHFLKRLELLTWYPMLKQLDYQRSGGGRNAFTTPLQRHATHGLDLGRWFTQPCIIVTGELRDIESPVPIRVDGREINSSSRVFVRWVYPLASLPPKFINGDPV